MCEEEKIKYGRRMSPAKSEATIQVSKESLEQVRHSESRSEEMGKGASGAPMSGASMLETFCSASSCH